MTSAYESNAYLPLFLTYPKLMERTQTREDTPTEPTTVASLSGVPRGVYFSLENDKILGVPGKVE